jgi:ABC-type transporter Mla maintaining outer membrane lipid asymmetry ATPase subunit MlaF
MLQLEKVKLAFDDTVLFEDLSLRVDSGQICCIRTGVLDGATTLLKCMAGIQEPNSGHCLLKGHSPDSYADAELPHLVCFCYEAGGLVSLFSVYENIVLPLVYHQGVNPATLQSRVAGIADALFIGDCLHQRVYQLNDVQMRLVNMARAVLLGSQLVLLDEFQEGMSPQMRDAVLAYFLAHCREKNVTAIMTTTAGDETGFADRLLAIENERLLELS